MRIFVNEFCGHPFQMELSRYLARNGHEVCHVYFADNHSTPKGQAIRPDDSPTLSIEGLHIGREFSKYSLRTRRLADMEYGAAVAARLGEFRPDVVISANMPPDGQRLVLHATRKAGARFVYWLQDVYAEAVRFVLRRRARLLASAGSAYFRWLERKLLKDSDAIVCISSDFAELLRGWGIPESKIAVIENWAPLDEVKLLPKDNSWARTYGVADRFCFLYSGTLGMKHRPEVLLELAGYLERRGDGRLIVVAGGAGADWLAARANQVSREVLTLLPFQPYDRISEVFASADVLITLLDSEAGSFAVPSKTLSYLCAGRALMVAAPRANLASRVVESAQAGLTVFPDDPAGIIRAAALLMENVQMREQFGANARQYAERTFPIDKIAKRFLALFEDRAQERSGAKGYGASPEVAQ